MAVTFENVVIVGDNIEPGKLIWRRYRRPAPGIKELFLDINVHLREHLIASPYLPVGVGVLIPIDADILAGAPSPIDAVALWGTVPAAT